MQSVWRCTCARLRSATVLATARPGVRGDLAPANSRRSAGGHPERTKNVGGSLRGRPEFARLELDADRRLPELAELAVGEVIPERGELRRVGRLGFDQLRFHESRGEG